jgi:hypothetical protein
LSAFFGSYSIGYFTSPLINKTPNFCHCFENPIKYPPGKIEAEKLPPPLDIQSPQLEGVHGDEMLFKLSTVAEIKIKTAFSSANGGVCRKFESFVRNLEGFAPPPPPPPPPTGKSEFPPLAIHTGYTLRETSQTSYSPDYITPTQKKNRDENNLLLLWFELGKY